MHQYEISLSTGKDAADFVSSVRHVTSPVRLSDGSRFETSGKSLLGVIWALTWDRVFCRCESDISEQIDKFICREVLNGEA